MADSCCNPFDLPRHNWSSRQKKLRPVLEWMCRKAAVSVGAKICDVCRKKLAKQPDLDALPGSPVHQSTDALPDSQYFDTPEAVASVNRCLREFGETPLPAAACMNYKQIEQKMDKITETMKELILENKPDSNSHESDENEIISQLKEKFQATTQRSDQLQILTVLPKSWSKKRIQAEFGVSDYMARKSKQLVQEKGILSTPDPKVKHSLPDETVRLVTEFYESDQICRTMPGKKDFVSVRQEGKRVHVQKKLVLCNLKEAYHAFKDANPGLKIGFSKFAELRPPQCVLAGASGTHSVCVCTIHQNVKLMFSGARISELVGTNGNSFPSYHHCLARILCNPPLPACHLGDCSYCPGISSFRDDLIALLDESLIDNITFKQWVSVDRCTLETYTKPVEEFVDIFCEKLDVLRPHAFIATQQASFYQDRKSTLTSGEVLVVADFSENYSFVLQDAAQGFHWNNSQATIHPFVAYYKNQDDKLCHISYVVISESLHHDTTAVFLYQKCFIKFLKAFLATSSFRQLCKVIYFSDGAGSQYKNRKNFTNLCHHEEDFGIPAEWHFTATAHGKGACDGIGGTVKRLAARASLQKPFNDQIMTPRQLFDWASANIQGVHFDYCSLAEYEAEEKNLKERFEKSRTIPGTRKLHSFIPISKTIVSVKSFSSEANGKEEHVTDEEDNIPVELISGFITCVFAGEWWLACVLQLSEDENQVEVTLLHPPGPSNSYKYPANELIVTVRIGDVLTTVDPRSRSGRVYTLSRMETMAALDKFSKVQ